jgi:uncharacterized protein YjbI with pentapeptide repeats
MANDDHVAMLRKSVDAWNTWRDKNLNIRPDLSGVDLSRANLGGANFGAIRPDFNVIKIEGAGDLTQLLKEDHTQLAKAPDLRSARFIEADLSKANLMGADLKGADLSGADLKGADLSGADLSGANLGEIKLEEANVTPAQMNRMGVSTLGTVPLRMGTDLTGANLRMASLTGANLSGASLSGADLSWANGSEANLGRAKLSKAQLTRAQLSGANLMGATLIEADLSWAECRGANLSGAILAYASLNGADLSGANLSEATLYRAVLYGANLSKADLRKANLGVAILVNADLRASDLTGCRIHGVSAWNLKLEDAKQQNLVITADAPEITVDNIEIAQFIHLLLHNEKIRDVIDTITSKVVLILGRFTHERKAVLDAVREELRKHNYLPILFDFDVPATRDITETVSLLARMARFIVADLTDPSSIPKELEAIVPGLAVPVQPLLEGASRPYAMFKDYWKYDWVLPVYRYEGIEPLLATLAEKVIAPAEGKVRTLEERRRMIEAELTKPQ